MSWDSEYTQMAGNLSTYLTYLQPVTRETRRCGLRRLANLQAGRGTLILRT